MTPTARSEAYRLSRLGPTPSAERRGTGGQRRGCVIGLFTAETARSVRLAAPQRVMAPGLKDKMAHLGRILAVTQNSYSSQARRGTEVGPLTSKPRTFPLATSGRSTPPTKGRRWIVGAVLVAFALPFIFGYAALSAVNVAYTPVAHHVRPRGPASGIDVTGVVPLIGLVALLRAEPNVRTAGSLREETRTPRLRRTHARDPGTSRASAPRAPTSEVDSSASAAARGPSSEGSTLSTETNFYKSSSARALPLGLVLAGRTP